MTMIPIPESPDDEGDCFFSVQNLNFPSDGNYPEGAKFDLEVSKLGTLDSPINENVSGKSSYGPSHSRDSRGLPTYSLRRLVSKSGSCRVTKLPCSHHGQISPLTLLSDIYTSLIEARWRWVMFWFALSFLVTWYLFAVLWWVIAYHHGDLKSSPIQDPFNDTGPCVTNLDDFMSCFLFSMETQYSTGYGSRLPNTHCPDAIFLLSVQSIFGVLINALTGGIIFVKLAKPKKRSQHLLFSEKAVICQRDGIFHLIWRIGDLRKSHLIGASLKAWFLCRRRTREGEMIPRYKYKLGISVDHGGADTLFQWPLEVCHRIVPGSPLYPLSAFDLLSAKFEIVTSLNATIESSGLQIEAKSSYLPAEIQWGARFAPMFIKQNCRYFIDYAKFQRIIQVDTPLCSPHEYDKLLRGEVEENAEESALNEALMEVEC